LLAGSAPPSVEDHFDALEPGERSRQVSVEVHGLGIQDEEHAPYRPRSRRGTLRERREQLRPMVIADAVSIAGIVERCPLPQEPRLAFFLTPRAPRLHRADLRAQVMPAANVNRGAALRARLCRISPNREKVRQRGLEGVSVDDVYVLPSARSRTPRKPALCKGFAALEYSVLFPRTVERASDALGRGDVMRWRVVVGVLAVTLTGAMAPAQATPMTSSATTSLDTESDHVTLLARTALASPSDVELESFARDLAPASNHDASRQSSMTTATPPPSMLLLVGTGLTGLAGMVRRRLARRHRIAW